MRVVHYNFRGQFSGRSPTVPTFFREEFNTLQKQIKYLHVLGAQIHSFACLRFLILICDLTRGSQAAVLRV